MPLQTSAPVSCCPKTLGLSSPSTNLHSTNFFFFNPICDLRQPVATHKVYYGCSLPSAKSSFCRFLISRDGTMKSTGYYGSKMDFVVYSSNQEGDLDTLGNLIDSWKNWIPGILAIIIVPLFANKWGPFAKLKEEVDMVEETMVKIADEEEEVSAKVEKVVEDIGEDLPDGKLKKALNLIDDVAKQAAKDAQLAEAAIIKVEEVEKEVESLVDSIVGFDKSNATTKVD